MDLQFSSLEHSPPLRPNIYYIYHHGVIYVGCCPSIWCRRLLSLPTCLNHLAFSGFSFPGLFLLGMLPSPLEGLEDRAAPVDSRKVSHHTLCRSEHFIFTGRIRTATFANSWRTGSLWSVLNRTKKNLTGGPAACSSICTGASFSLRMLTVIIVLMLHCPIVFCAWHRSWRCLFSYVGELPARFA